MHIQLGSRFAEAKVQLDVTTFRYDGHIEGYEHDSNRQDAHIYFCAPTEEQTDEIINTLREGLAKTYKVDVETYVKAYQGDHFNYPKDKEPRRTIQVRLPSGSRGIANPAYFSFTE